MAERRAKKKKADRYTISQKVSECGETAFVKISSNGNEAGRQNTKEVHLHIERERKISENGTIHNTDEGQEKGETTYETYERGRVCGT